MKKSIKKLKSVKSIKIFGKHQQQQTNGGENGPFVPPPSDG